MRLRRKLPGVLFALAILALLAAGALVATAPGLRLLASLIGTIASTQTRVVQIDGLSGVANGALRIERVAVAGGEGPVAVLEKVALDWSPLALLTGKLAVKRLTVGRGEILRPFPAAAQDDGSGQDSGGIFAIAADIKAFSFKEIVLGDQLIGQTARFTAHGNLLIDDVPRSVRLELDAERIDGVTGTAHAHVAVQPDRNKFDLEVALAEPAGGMLARLLDVAGLPAISIDVKSAGKLDNWVTDLAVGLDGREAVTGQARIVALEDGHRLAATLNGTPGPFLPASVTPFAAGNVSLALDISRKEDGSLTVTTADLASATTRLSNSGSVDFGAGMIDLTSQFGFADSQSEISFTLPDGSQARSKSINLDIQAKGALSDAALSVTGAMAGVEAAGFRGENIQLAAKARGADLRRQAIPFSLKLSADLLQTPYAQMNPLLAGPVNLDAEGVWREGEVKIEPARLSTAALQAALSGTAQVEPGSFDLALEGRVDGNASEYVRLAFGGGAVSLAARARRAGNGNLSVYDLRVQSDAASLAGAASLDAGNNRRARDIEGRFTMEVTDLARLHGEVSGSADAVLSLSGPLDAPRVAFSASGQSVTLAGKALESPSAAFDGVLSGAAPRGDLNVSAKLDGQVIEAKGHIVSENDDARAENIVIAVGNARITGSVDRLLSGEPTGRVEIVMPDLAVLGPLLLRDNLGGSLTGDIALVPEEGGLMLKVKLLSPSLVAADARLEEVAVDVVAADLTGELAVDGTISAAKASSGTTTLEQLSLKAESAGPATRFAARGQLDGAPLIVNGEFVARDGKMRLAFNEASGAFQGIVAKLAGPTTIAIENGAATLDTVRLDVGGGAVSVSGNAGEQLDLRVALKSFPARVVDRFAKQGLAGTLSGSIGVAGTPAAPLADYDIEWRDLSAAAMRDAGVPPLALAAKGRFADQTVNVDAAISGSGFDTRARGSVALGDDPRTELAVSGTLPFSAAAATLAKSGLRLKGAAVLDLKIAGALPAPQITGSIATKDATFVDTGSSIVIRNVSGTARLSGKQVNLAGLTGTLGERGKLDISGTIGTDGAAGYPADLKIQMRNTRYADGTLIAATFDADLSLKGSLVRSPVLGGRVDVARADISIPEKLPGGVTPLGVRHVNAPAGVARQTEKLESEAGSTDKDGGEIGLDLTVSAPRRIFVRGRGIDAELGGELRLTGTTRETRAVGGFNLIRGRLDILTKRVSMDRGVFTFAGSLDPVIDFSASTTGNSVTATILVTGLASAPEISFTSTPSLPEDEVLAHLLFDESMSSLSPTQLLQLAAAIGTLTGGGGNTGVLDRVRDMLGVDDIDITSDEGGTGTAVGVGRYLDDRTYIGVRQGTNSGSTSVTTKIDITDSLKAKGEVTSEGKAKTGIFFEKEY